MSTPIKTALCSFGMSGKVFHAPLLHHHPGYHLYGAYERSGRNAEKIYPSIKHFSSLHDLLQDQEVELVIVNTPNQSHYEYAKQALLAGKHVVVEKPFVAASAQAKELAKLAIAAGKKLAVYQNRRYDSDFMTVKKVIADGVLGTIVEAEIHYDRYNLQLSPKAHKETPAEATGIVYDLGSHIIDQALHLFGMPQAVFADMMKQRPSSQVDDYFEILLYYQGTRVRLKGGYVVKQPVPAYAIHGTQGSFLKERGDVQETNLQAGRYNGPEGWGQEPDTLRGTLTTIGADSDNTKLVETLPGNYALFYDALYRAIRNDAPEPVTAADGINVITIIEAAYKSYNDKRVVLVDEHLTGKKSIFVV